MKSKNFKHVPSNTEIADLNPAGGWMYLCVILCCVSLYRLRPWDGPIPHLRSTTPTVISETYQLRGLPQVLVDRYPALLLAGEAEYSCQDTCHGAPDNPSGHSPLPITMKREGSAGLHPQMYLEHGH